MADSKKKTISASKRLALLVTAAVLLSVWSMPKSSSTKFEYKEGTPWIYEELIAPASFSVEKTEASLQQEKDSITASFIPYFDMDTTVWTKALARFEVDWQNGLDTIISYNTYNLLKEKMAYIYSAGIIEQEDESKICAEYLRGISGTESRLIGKASVHTLKSAYQDLATINVNSQERSHIARLGLENYLIPTLKYNAARSETALNDLISQISKYSGMVMAGQKIIGHGELVTAENSRAIKSYQDFIAGRTESTSFRLMTWAGHLLYLVIIYFLLAFYMNHYRRDIVDSRSKLVFLFSAVTLFTVLTCLYIKYSSWSIFILPCTMLALMLRIFLDSRTAFMGYLVYVLSCSIVTPMPYEFLLLQTVAGLAAIYSVHELSQRSQIFTSAFFILLAYCLVWLTVQMIQVDDLRQVQWEMFIYFAVNCFILLLTYPLVFAIEKLFGFTSNVTLIELSNFSNPLLVKLAELAPGTFQHSIQVSTLAAEAAKTIGASSQLVRTAALYHDIGKMANAPFFTENQSGVNPHDKLSLKDSAQIITSHVSDGVKLAEKYNLPTAIKDFILTHHGKGTARYFYIKYQNEHPDEQVDPAPFQYLGVNPFSKETAILMMADAVEASSRSLKEYTDNTIGALVDKIIDSQTNEGYFRECPITFREIQQVKETFKEKLHTMYHTRISYPEATKPTSWVQTTLDLNQKRQ